MGKKNRKNNNRSRNYTDNMAALMSNKALDTLVKETDFLRYLELLHSVARTYTVLVASSDTPFGPCFTPEVCAAFMNAGFRTNLYGKFRCAYAAILDRGNIVFERVTENAAGKPIRIESEIDGNRIEMASSGHDMELGSTASIRVNGKEYAQPQCGLNFVVYDRRNDRVLDAVHFHTYAETILARRRRDLAERWHQYQKAHPGVSVVLFSSPPFPKDNLTAGETFIRQNKVTIDVILHNLDKPVFTLNQYYDPAGVAEVLTVPQSYRDVNGVRRLVDARGKLVNIVGGHRITVGQPEVFDHTIWFVGGCNIFGVGTDDARTLSSVVQARLNRQCPEKKFVCQNYGFFLAQGDAKGMEEFAILESLPVRSGDIVVMSGERTEGLYHVDASDLSGAREGCELFFDLGHNGPDGYRLIAERIFEGLRDQGLLEHAAEGSVEEDHDAGVEYGFTPSESVELDDYRKRLRKIYLEGIRPRVGAIVMNCNPFTLGHRYLVDEALKACDILVVFVVEEDKSVFPFADRLALVKACTEDVADRLRIIPSGRFVISSLTFSEYFNKSELQERKIDPSMDVTVFAREIAPCMDITKRFAGEEPNDGVTRQYNEAMARILPEYGIEFVEIPRLSCNGQIISASNVRKLLEQGRPEEIKHLVPQATYEYCLGRMGSL